MKFIRRNAGTILWCICAVAWLAFCTMYVIDNPNAADSRPRSTTK